MVTDQHSLKSLGLCFLHCRRQTSSWVGEANWRGLHIALFFVRHTSSIISKTYWYKQWSKFNALSAENPSHNLFKFYLLPTSAPDPSHPLWTSVILLRRSNSSDFLSYLAGNCKRTLNSNRTHSTFSCKAKCRKIVHDFCIWWMHNSWPHKKTTSWLGPHMVSRPQKSFGSMIGPH